jgi:hypothetical protein
MDGKWLHTGWRMPLWACGPCMNYPQSNITAVRMNGFVLRLIDVLNNYSICPIVFNVYEQLKSEFKHNT